MPKPAIAFFVFNRPNHTERVFEEIRRFRPDQLLLIADGPRASVSTDAAHCAAVRKIIGNIDWPCVVKQNFAEHNLGCKRRMSSGLDWVFSEVEEAIVLEDDCLPCPDFFRFASELLQRYRYEPSVSIISGDNFQDGQKRGEASYYFSRYIHIWGWATWRRAWRHYDVSIRSWPQMKNSGWFKRLGMEKTEAAYWSNIFDRVYSGQVDTWDYQWVYACWRQNGLGIMPNVNLITNIGASPDATHTKGAEGSLAIPTGTIAGIIHPTTVRRHKIADQYTFDVHYGGDGLRRNAHPLWRLRKFLGLARRKVATMLFTSQSK